jgi:hypothetical protein
MPHQTVRETPIRSGTCIAAKQQMVRCEHHQLIGSHAKLSASSVAVERIDGGKVERIDGGKLRCTGATWSDAVMMFPAEVLAFQNIERQAHALRANAPARVWYSPPPAPPISVMTISRPRLGTMPFGAPHDEGSAPPDLRPLPTREARGDTPPRWSHVGCALLRITVKSDDAEVPPRASGGFLRRWRRTRIASMSTAPRSRARAPSSPDRRPTPRQTERRGRGKRRA